MADKNFPRIYIYIFIMGMNGFKVLQFLVVTDKYIVSWFDSRPGPDMTTCQIQPVQRDRMPSGPTKYLSVFKYNHLEWKKMQHFWMHRTTCHHYGCTWPSNKSYHQQQPHTKWHVLNERSYRKLLKSFHFQKISIFVEMFEKSLFSEKKS